jgi:hypothetical protein
MTQIVAFVLALLVGIAPAAAGLPDLLIASNTDKRDASSRPVTPSGKPVSASDGPNMDSTTDKKAKGQKGQNAAGARENDPRGAKPSSAGEAK